MQSDLRKKFAWKFLQTCFPKETPGHYWPFWRPVVGEDKLSPLSPVLGPEQKNWLCHRLTLLFMAVSRILNMWHSSGYCMRHSRRTKFGTITLNQLVHTVYYMSSVRLSSGSARDCSTFFLVWAACKTRGIGVEAWLDDKPREWWRSDETGATCLVQCWIV